MTVHSDEDDLIRRAIAAWFREENGWYQPPSRAESSVDELGGRLYVVLRAAGGTLTIYRVRNSGALKRLARWPNALRLDCAKRIAERLLPAIREAGEWKDCSGLFKLLSWRRGDLHAAYRSPFNKLPPNPEGFRYYAAAMGRRADPLPHGLDLWYCGRKVLSVQWSDDGDFDLISMRPGEWQVVAGAAA